MADRTAERPPPCHGCGQEEARPHTPDDPCAQAAYEAGCRSEDAHPDFDRMAELAREWAASVVDLPRWAQRDLGDHYARGVGARRRERLDG